METQNKQYDETEIDLLELAHVLLAKWKILLVCLVAGAVLAGGYTKLMVTPLYTSSSMVYIYSKTTSVTSLADLQIGSQLTIDFQTLATSRPVLEKVIDALHLDTTCGQLLKSITVSNPTNTRILKISVTNSDPQLAADISNAMAEALSDRVAEVMSTDKPYIAETAIPAAAPSSPSTERNVMIGALLGLVLSAGVILLRYFLDDSIKTADDVQKYLQLNTLASIPLERGREDTSKKAGKKSTHHISSKSEHGKSVPVKRAAPKKAPANEDKAVAGKGGQQ